MQKQWIYDGVERDLLEMLDDQQRSELIYLLNAHGRLQYRLDVVNESVIENNGLVHNLHGTIGEDLRAVLTREDAVGFRKRA